MIVGIEADDSECIVSIYRVGPGVKEKVGEYHCEQVNESEEYICTYIEWGGCIGKYMNVSCDKHEGISSFDGSYVEFPYGLIVSDDLIEEVDPC